MPFFSAGFSLIEMLFYVAIMTIIFLAIVETVVLLASSYNSVKANNAVLSSALFSLDRMVREIRNSNGVNNTGSVFGVNPGSLLLNTTDDSGNPRTVQFYIDSGKLSDKENGVYAGPLTSSGAKVSRLVFYQINSVKSQAIKIEMTIQSGTGTASTSANFYGTATIRNSY